MELDGTKVKEARSKEIQDIQEKQVWRTIPRRQAMANGWTVMDTDGLMPF